MNESDRQMGVGTEAVYCLFRKERLGRILQGVYQRWEIRPDRMTAAVRSGVHVCLWSRHISLGM